MLEWQRDWAERDTYDAVMDIVKNHCGAYGVGVEYAYTMVHGAPATKIPDSSCRPQRPETRNGLRRGSTCPSLKPLLHRDP